MNSRRRVKVPESTPCSSATVWANRRANRYGSPRAVGDVLGPGPGEARGPGMGFGGGQQARLAHARLADHDDDAAASGLAGIGRWRSSGRPSSLVRPTSGPGAAARNGIQAPVPASPRSAWSVTGVDWPRRTTEPRSSVARRPRAAASVAPSSRISPGRASDWMRAAVVIASPVRPRSPPDPGPPATTSPVAIPMRTSMGSPPSPISCSPARIAIAASDGPDGVVVVAARPAEHGEDRVADELLAGAVEPLDRVGHRGQRRRDPGPDLLGVVLGDHPDVVDEVGEERRDDPPVAGLGADARHVRRPRASRRPRRAAASSAVPQRSQKRAPAAPWAPHDGQRTPGPRRLRRSR